MLFPIVWDLLILDSGAYIIIDYIWLEVSYHLVWTAQLGWVRRPLSWWMGLWYDIKKFRVQKSEKFSAPTGASSQL